MMVSASWRGGMVQACGSLLAMETIFTSRFPLAVDAVTRLPAHSFLLDGEAIVTNDRGLAVFDLIRHQRHGGDAVLIAFDLIELEGEDLRRTPIEHAAFVVRVFRRRTRATISGPAAVTRGGTRTSRKAPSLLLSSGCPQLVRLRSRLCKEILQLQPSSAALVVREGVSP